MSLPQEGGASRSFSRRDGRSFTCSFFAFSRPRSTQVFSGTSSPSTVIRTVGTTYDPVGNTLSVVTSDGSGTAQATYSATYDGLKRLTGFNDADLGSCANTPMPADCSGPTDTAWKYT